MMRVPCPDYASPAVVTTGLVPVVHAEARWIAGTRPAMTVVDAIPLPIGERVDRPKAETGEGELSARPTIIPLIRPFGPPSPRWGEEQGRWSRPAKEQPHV